jgi:hypothetical protein
MSTSVFSIAPPRTPQKRVITACTPTKRAKLVVLHENCELTFDEIATRSPFKHTTLHPSTLCRNYNQVKEHDEDCYWDGRKGHGRKRKIPEEDLNEAIRRIDAGELIDGEDVRREMLPDVPGRTVRMQLTPCEPRI